MVVTLLMCAGACPLTQRRVPAGEVEIPRIYPVIIGRPG